jgi:O-antigen ligase
VVIWTKRTRDVGIGFVVLAILWAGLVLSFSQSSFAALLVGLAVLAALRWSVKWTVVVCAVAVCVGLGVVLLAPGAINLDLSKSNGADKATSGRVDLIKGGARLFKDRPFLGWGSGSYSVVFRREENVSVDRATTASHTIPVTVAAEQGIVGLAVYLALLVAMLARLFGAGVARSPLRAYVASAFVALLVHTMTYAAFLEDPITWTLLGIGIALAAAAAAEGPRERSREERELTAAQRSAARTAGG